MNEYNRSYICTAVECGRQLIFASQTTLQRHQREVHNLNGGREEFLCSYPGCEHGRITNGFTRKAALVGHEKMHNDLKNDLKVDHGGYLCSYSGCWFSQIGKGFTRKAKLAHHLEVMHKKVQTSAENKKDSEDPESSITLLPGLKRYSPRVEPSRLQLSDFPEMRFQPSQIQLQPEAVPVPGRKRSRQIEPGDEIGKELDTVEVSSIEVKQLEQVIKDQNGLLVEKDGQLVEAGRQLEKKDGLLVKKDRQLGEKDRQLVEKNRQLADMDARLAVYKELVEPAMTTQRPRS